MTWHNDIFEMHQRYGVHGWMETHRHDPEMMKKFLEFRVKFLEEELEIVSIVQSEEKTGVEMEALTAASIAALTVYDMCKAVDRFMTIDNVQLLEKKGGKSGHWVLES